MTRLLELLCQLILAYQSYKALKPAPAARKRRRANADGRNTSVYAETVRRRRIRSLAKAWVVLAVCTSIEWLLQACLAWWLPFYSTLRSLLYIGFAGYHAPVRKLADLVPSFAKLLRQLSEIAFSKFLTPFIRPYEKRLNTIFDFFKDLVDVASWPLTLLVTEVRQVLAIVVLGPVRRLCHWLAWPYRVFRSSKAAVLVQNAAEADEEKKADAKTPRRSTQRSRPRFSQVATPHVPGHLIEEEIAFPPVQLRLDPAERSLDDLPAFQEALDRAQAAFYEASSPQRGKPSAADKCKDHVDPAQHAPKSNAGRGDGHVDRSSRRRKASRAADSEHEESPKRRKVADGGSASIATDAIAELGKEGEEDRLAKSDGKSSSRRSRPGLSKLPIASKRASAEPQIAEAAVITRSSQRARESALAARKRAREEALAKKVIAGQVDSRTAKRKKAA